MGGSRESSSLSRTLMLWLGSYVIVAIGLFCYARIPLGPLLIAGALTCALTLVKYRAAQKRREKSVRRP